MTKKDYLKPAMTVIYIDLNEQLMVGSVKTTGLDNDDLTQDDTPGNAWGNAMSRRRNNVWDEEEEE